MATETQPRQWTYDDLRRFPDDNFRREVIDGELIVTPAPATRHQRVVLRLGADLLAYAKEHGGEPYVAPTDVFFADTDVVEPDVLFLGAARADRVEEQLIRGAPDLVVEVSSPSTRHLELVRKRALYEREGVPEYWYIDLEAERVEVYRLDGDGAYGAPSLVGRGARLEPVGAPGAVIEVSALLGA